MPQPIDDSQKKSEDQQKKSEKRLSDETTLVPGIEPSQTRSESYIGHRLGKFIIESYLGGGRVACPWRCMSMSSAVPMSPRVDFAAGLRGRVFDAEKPGLRQNSCSCKAMSVPPRRIISRWRMYCRCSIFGADFYDWRGGFREINIFGPLVDLRRDRPVLTGRSLVKIKYQSFSCLLVFVGITCFRERENPIMRFLSLKLWL